jgi:AraC family transcriptional regulator, regulatory protein of adaptative response / methylated-DNA-[protein]-cysteine methyltransferase
MTEFSNKTINQFWEAFQKRDKSFDGKFYVGVKTTGIYCKPSCAARQPKFENCVFFATRDEAVQAGFRACKRCKPDIDEQVEGDSDLFQRATKVLEQQMDSINSVQAWAETLDVDLLKLRRAVKQVAGISLREFMMNKKVEAFKQGIQSGENVTSALYSAGFGSSSRLYERAFHRLGMTPGKYKNGGHGEKIVFTVMNTPYGELLVAATQKGLCSIKFGKSGDDLAGLLRNEFPRAEILTDKGELAPWVQKLQQYFSGFADLLTIPLDVQATAFQLRVWEELRCIPFGETRSYAQVANAIGKPKAVRAVASACAANPVALVTPCHRVIHSDGSISGYRWGTERKKALLEAERITAAGNIHE